MNITNTNGHSFADLQTIASNSPIVPNGQDRIGTGKKLILAKDPVAIWSISQNLGSTSPTIDVVTKSLDRGEQNANVALAAGAEISDLLDQIKDKVLPAPIANLSASSLLKLFR
jgi:flagellin